MNVYLSNTFSQSESLRDFQVFLRHIHF